MSQNILELVRNEILDYEKSQRKEAQEDDSAFCNALRDFFLEHYPVEKMGKVFFRLKALLESEYEFVPELVMEYAMYFLIKARIETADRLGIRIQEPLSYQRDYVVKALRIGQQKLDTLFVFFCIQLVRGYIRAIASANHNACEYK